MLCLKPAAMLAILCVLGTAAPAMAGSLSDDPPVILGLGPQMAENSYVPPPNQAGRYGGGFIEFLMTGNSTVGAPWPASRASVASVNRYASYDGTGGPEQVQPAAAGPAGYDMPRKAPDPAYQRQEVGFDGRQPPGTVVIDTENKFLYLIEDGGRALRYGIGVGRPGFLWHGEKTITRKAEWPDWTPPSEMLKRRPDLPLHMEGGIANPLGARAMYLGSSLYRIHGTNEPDTIGTNVSSGCIRLTNDDVADLFTRVRIGTKVIVL